MHEATFWIRNEQQDYGQAKFLEFTNLWRDLACPGEVRRIADGATGKATLSGEFWLLVIFATLQK